MHAFAERDEGKAADEKECLPERLFRRGDNTFAYFFTVDEVVRLMRGALLELVDCRTEQRVTENRKNGAVMRRNWLVGRFRKPPCAP